MIDEDRTMQLYGYTRDQLTFGSHKYVVAVCEECGRYHIYEMRRSRKLCSSCSSTGEGNSFFGKKHTLETCLIIGEASKGRHHTDETKIRLSRLFSGKNNYWFGKHLTDEHKEKISKSEKGRKLTDEEKLKLSRRMTGKNHWNWQGGIATWRSSFHNSAVYKNWHEAVFERDDYTCQICNERGGYLESHHILPIRDNKNTLLIIDINNGITLCKKCHNDTKGREYEFVEQFEDIIRGKQA